MLAAILLFVGLGGHALYQERLRIGEAEHDRMFLQAGIAADRIDREMETVVSALDSIRGSPTIFDRRDPDGTTSQRLGAIGRLMPGTAGVRIVDRDGIVRAATDRASVGSTIAEHPLFRTVQERQETASVPGVLSRVYRDSRGAFDGLVYATLDRTYTEGLLAAVSYAPDMRMSLTDARGNLLAEAPPHLSGEPASAVHPPPIGRMGVVRTLQPDMATPERALRVGATRALDDIYRPWTDRMRIYAVLVLVLAGVCVAALWSIQRRRNQKESEDMRRMLDEKSRSERLDFMLSGADVGLWDWDIAGRRIEFNTRWRSMLGRLGEAAVQDAEQWLTLVHPDDAARVRASIADHWEGETEVHEAEYRMRHESGRWIWVLDRGKVMQRDAHGVPTRMVGAHMDISQHKRADEALRLSEARFRALTELSSDWYWELDELHRFVRFEGYPGAEVRVLQEDNIGLTRWHLGALNMNDEDWAEHRRVLDAHEVFHDLELQRLDSTGAAYWVSISGAPIFDAQGTFRGYRGIGRSITERKRVEDEIERLAFYDSLTGLPNRRLLLDRLVTTLGNCRVRGERGALLFIDLDNFKDLNDTMGHDVGDSLLERVANRLVTCVKPGDTVARLGGDEFVVMLESLAGEEATATRDARTVGERVLSVLNHPYLLDGYQHHSTPSLGIALFDGQVQSVDELLKRADLAMYQAKAAGRNTLCFFHPDLQHAVIQRSALEGDLRGAIDRGEMLLFYQPVVDHRAQLTGAEALVRWRHPERGMVSPGEFIPLAEQTGLILRIGQWVLQTACEQLVEWARQPETRELTVAVNVSAREFRQADFVRQVLSTLERTGGRADRLKIELTESLLLNDVEDIIAKMGELKSHGVGFSLDDFGTGYSSLSYLKRLPLDQLKIDQSFVRDVLSDPNDAAIVRTILALADSLDLAVVAEGVETVGQLDFLTESGCRAFQGYLFGRPSPVQVMLGNLQPVSVGH